jgi:hypothetical protein
LFCLFREQALVERQLLHRRALTQLRRLVRLPETPYRSSNLGSFRTKA